MSPAARAAAKARAEAEQQAEAQAAAAAKAAKAATARKPVRHFKEPPAAQIRFGRTSPAAQAKAFLTTSTGIAVLAAAQQSGDIDLSSADTQLVLQFEADRKHLKDIKATDRKIEAKRQMLPFYKGWIDGFMAAATHEKGPFDQIFTQLMAWTIDTGDYLSALPMLEHVMDLGLDMPAHFNRDPITFAIDQICEAALTAFDLGGDYAKGFDAGILPALQDLVKQHEVDLHDEVEAKLFKTLGRAIMHDAERLDEGDVAARRASQQAALDAYRTAFTKHDRVGVKKDIEKLERELKKSDPAAAPPAA